MAHAVLGEGAQLGHHVEGLAVEVVPDRAIGDLAGRKGGRTEVAEIGVAGDAHLAATTDREEAGGHVVTGLKAGDVWTHLEDHPSPFVPAHHGEESGPGWLTGTGLRAHLARLEMLVRVAQARCRPLDQRLMPRGCIEIDFLDPPVLVPAPQDRCMCLHRPPVPWVIPDCGAAPRLTTNELSVTVRRESKRGRRDDPEQQ